MTSKKQIKIKGKVDSIVFKNPENGFCIFNFVYKNELITALGEIGDIEEKDELTLTGHFETKETYGNQFQVEFCETTLPETEDEIRRYLASGAIKDIGESTAKEIVSEFGEKTLEIIQNEPEKLIAVNGITLKKAKEISADFKKNFASTTLINYVKQFGISARYGMRAWKRWGDSAIEIIQNNPYDLCIEGIGLPFKKADDFAFRLDFPIDCQQRIRAIITYVLKNFANEEGHTCVQKDVLINTCAYKFNIEPQKIETILEDEIKEENLYLYEKENKPFVMLKDYYTAEDYIARRLEIMREISYDNEIDFSEVIDLEEEKNNIKYEKIQRQAINLALSKGFLVMTGGPGTGKTTTLNAIISLYKQQKLNVKIAAPTGRAAKRISDLTGYEAKTIHRLLEVKYTSNDLLSFVHNEDNLLDCDALIVDEMSMVDAKLFESLLRAISISCKLILVGDVNQLPSVSAGNVLKDIIDSGVMSVVTLKEIFRQSQDSDIVMNAHKIENGEIIDFKKRDKDFFFMQRTDFQQVKDLVVELCKKRLPDSYKISPVDDIQVLSPTKKTIVGTVELNKILQEELNPPADDKTELKGKTYIYRLGDKVMQTKNNYDIEWIAENDEVSDEKKGKGIFNGDIGKITDIDTGKKTVTVNFEGRIATFKKDMLDNLELAYAVTVHKSQGSEFNVVVLPLFGKANRLYRRNVLYTAVTRAKKLLVVVGSTKLFEKMICTAEEKRNTALKNMLMANAEGNDSGQIKIDL